MAVFCALLPSGGPLNMVGFHEACLKTAQQTTAVSYAWCMSFRFRKPPATEASPGQGVAVWFAVLVAPRRIRGVHAIAWISYSIETQRKKPRFPNPKPRLLLVSLSVGFPSLILSGCLCGCTSQCYPHEANLVPNKRVISGKVGPTPQRDAQSIPRKGLQPNAHKAPRIVRILHSLK